jgi:predicted RNA-binding Zn-ribbon protein involved in translation (DUF1610 family)
MGSLRFTRRYLDIDVKNQVNYHVNLKMYLLECFNCKKLKAFGTCPECGNTTFSPRQSPKGLLSVGCNACTYGLVSWICPQCGTDNPVARTFGTYEETHCFIATASFDDTFAPEVVALREFRDNVLVRSRSGRLFIRAYYHLSPPIASLILSSRLLQVTSRAMLVRLVALLRKSRGLQHQKR